LGQTDMASVLGRAAHPEGKVR